MRRILTILIILIAILTGLLLPPLPLQAGVTPGSPSDSCDRFVSLKQVVACTRSHHPAILSAQKTLEQAESIESQAAQMPNPELESRSVAGLPGSGGHNIDLSLYHVFELGGKRGNRIQLSQAENKLNLLNYLSTQEEVALESVLALYRLRQIQTELRLFSGAQHHFTKIASKYHRRLRLSAEQRATLSILEIAGQGYGLRRLPLERERQGLIQHLILSSGTQSPADFESDLGRLELLPPFRTQWPKLPEPAQMRPLGGTLLQRALHRVVKAQAGLELEQSRAWPDVKIGPTLSVQSQFQQQFNALGVYLALPIPLYHRNGSRIAYQEKELTRSEVELRTWKTQLNQKRQYFYDSYTSSINGLKATLSLPQLVAKQDEVADLYERGLVPGGEVVELYRQSFDLNQAQNQNERNAMEALLVLYFLNGTSLNNLEEAIH